MERLCTVSLGLSAAGWVGKSIFIKREPINIIVMRGEVKDKAQLQALVDQGYDRWKEDKTMIWKKRSLAEHIQEALRNGDLEWAEGKEDNAEMVEVVAVEAGS